MYCITNKQLRHLKAVLRGYLKPALKGMEECQCKECINLRKAVKFLATLEPNA